MPLAQSLESPDTSSGGVVTAEELVIKIGDLLFFYGSSSSSGRGNTSNVGQGQAKIDIAKSVWSSPV